MKAQLTHGGFASGSHGGTTAIRLHGMQAFRVRSGSTTGKSQNSRKSQRRLGQAANKWSQMDYDLQTQWSNFQAEQQSLMTESGPIINSGYAAFSSFANIILGSGATVIPTAVPKVQAPPQVTAVSGVGVVLNSDGTIFLSVSIGYNDTLGFADTYSYAQVSKYSFEPGTPGKKVMTTLGMVNPETSGQVTGYNAAGSLTIPDTYKNGENMAIRIVTIRGGQRLMDLYEVIPVPAF